MRILPGTRDDLAFKRARSLRRLVTPAERRLWGAMRNGAAGGAKVKRQVPCGGFIFDFVFLASRLVIELDGFSHDSAVLDDLEGVVTAISVALDRPRPGPLP